MTLDLPGWQIAVVVIGGVLVIGGLMFWAGRATSAAGSGVLGGRGRRRPHRDSFRSDEQRAAPPRKRAAIIINPTKFDNVGPVRHQLSAACERLGWAEPLFIETTSEDPGTGQARRAVEEGADVVCPLGGDGTVRAVAAALAGTETPMGLLPGGTGNLLARNLDLPVDRVEDALEVALTGQNLRIDVGRLVVEHTPAGRPTTDDIPPGPGEPKPEDVPPPSEHIFLVMAGVGFDANVMADAPEALKAKVGWPAYVVSGARHLPGTRFKARLRVDHDEAISRRTQTILVGNCGRLTGGIELMPEAVINDGRLDCTIISPRGIVGWAAVAGDVLTKQRFGHRRLEHFSGTAFHIECDRPEQVQIDGDTIGDAITLTASVDPLALTVRVKDAVRHQRQATEVTDASAAAAAAVVARY